VNEQRHQATWTQVHARLLADLPELVGRDVGELLHAAAADGPKSLHALARYLADTPDALFTVDAASPAPATRLALVLHRAGIDRVVPPAAHDVSGRCH
jgi:hypothetical protein